MINKVGKSSKREKEGSVPKSQKSEIPETRHINI